MIGRLVFFAFVESPAMLGWLAAASAPLVIHLLNRRKFRESSWAAMQFLLAAVRKNSRRVQLEQWLLLALRTLLIVLFVLAAAQPGLKSVGLTAPAAERTHRVLVLDGSFSMDYKPTGDRSYFDQVKQLARRIVDRGREGDAYSLVVLGTPSRAVTSAPLARREDVLPLIDELTQPHGAGDLTSCLNEIDRVVGKTRETLPQIRRREIHFLTDLGRNTWEPTGAGRRTTALDEFQTRCERWGRETTVVVVDVGAGEGENTAVVEFTADEPFAVAGLPTTVRAVVRNFGRNPRTGITATLQLDGRKIDEKTLDIEAGGETTIVFDGTTAPAAARATRRIYEIRLAPDRLAVDDRRLLVLEVKPHLQVLVVHDPAPSAEAEFGLQNLETALRLKPGADAAAASPVRVEFETEAGVRRRELAEFDAVWVVDVRRFGADTIRALDEYVRHGGGLVFWLGGRVDAEHYNTQLADGRNLLPARLGPIATEPEYRLNPLKYEHPLLATFRGREQGGLLNTPVYRHFQLDTTKHPATRRVLEFLNERKDPFLVEAPLANGRTLTVAASLEASWTTLGLSPGFVPLVQEMLSYSVGGRAAAAAHLVGEPLGGTFRRTTATAQVTVDVPTHDEPSGGSSATSNSTPQATGTAAAAAPRTMSDATAAHGTAAEIVPQGENYRWALADVPLAGLYTAHISGPPPVVEPFAVNVDPHESDPTKLSPGRLTERTWEQVRFVYGTDVRDFSEPQQSFVAVGEANPWHRKLLFLAFAAALAETWWAGRIGRRRL
jgi:SAM-dependent methyltransferase